MKFYKNISPTAAQLAAGLLCVGFGALVLLYPAPAAQGVREGLLLCARVVIPSLFPFSVAALFLFKTGLFTPRSPGGGFFKSGRAAVFLMSMLAGYPVGARLVRTVYQSSTVDRTTAGRMVCYCVNAGPAFVVVAVGLGCFGLRRVGWLLLAAHLLASLLLCLFMELTHKPAPARPSGPILEPPFVLSDTFVSATADGCTAMFSVCGWVVLFSAVGAVVQALPIPKAVTQAICAVLEVTTGTAATGSLKMLPLTAALLGFSGVCVHFQVLSAAGEARPPVGLFLLSRLAHGGLSALLTWLFLRLLPLNIPVLSLGLTPQGVGNAASLPAALSLLFMCVVFLFSLRQEQI